MSQVKKSEMTSWATVKVLNSGLWLAGSLYNWGHWVVFGNVESEELKIAKANQKRLSKIEEQLDQIWAIQNNIIDLDPIDNTLMESIVLVNKDGTESNIKGEGIVVKIDSPNYQNIKNSP